MSEETTTGVLLRINITGYAGDPVSVFAAYDPGTDVLLIAKVAKTYDGGPRDGFLKVTNQVLDKAHDAMFTEDHISEAIRAYFDLNALKLLTLGQQHTALSPASRIEPDGMSESGQRYRISPDITNGQVAVLAACHAAQAQRGYAAAVDMADELLRVQTI